MKAACDEEELDLDINTCPFCHERIALGYVWARDNMGSHMSWAQGKCCSLARYNEPMWLRLLRWLVK